MIWFLDTNIIIYHLNGKSEVISKRLRGIDEENIKIPGIVAAELYYGAYKSQKPDYNLKRFDAFLAGYEVISVDQNVAWHYGKIRARLEKAGQPIGPNDVLIAATVLANKGTLVTHNVKEFAKVEGLLVEDWSTIG